MPSDLQAELRALIAATREETKHLSDCGTRWGVAGDTACTCERLARFEAELARRLEIFGRKVLDYTASGLTTTTGGEASDDYVLHAAVEAAREAPHAD